MSRAGGERGHCYDYTAARQFDSSLQCLSPPSMSTSMSMFALVCRAGAGAHATRVLPQEDLPHPIWKAPQLCCQLAAWNYLYRISVNMNV